MTDEDLRHGGALDRVAAQFKHAPLPWVDLSTGINPWPLATEPIASTSLHHLPTQKDMDRCRMAMAQAFGANANALVLVAGTEMAIRLLPQILPATRVAVLSPSYADHVESWTTAGAEVIETPDPLSHAETADVVVVCHPNNPDGRCFDPSSLMKARAELANRGGWLVVDEAYADLMPSVSLAPQAGAAGLVVLRSTGKFFGLAGLRLGAVLCPPALQTRLEGLLGVWRVSGTALSIGTRAYLDVVWQDATRARLAEARGRLDALLETAGVRIAGGTDLFRFVQVSDAYVTWRRLCENGVYTRRFRWTRSHLRLGLPDTPEAETRLQSALSL